MTTQQPAETHHDGEVQEELLTPGAAALLFGISESTVRAARLPRQCHISCRHGDFR